MRLLFRTLAFASTCLIALHAPVRADAADGVAGAGTPTSDRVKIWVYFTDHGEADPSDLRAMLDRTPIGARARERRLRRGSRTDATVLDLPVHDRYLDALRALGCDVRRASRYFNAVSAWVHPGDVTAVAALPFVRRTAPVRVGRRPAPPDPLQGRPGDFPLSGPGPDDAARYGTPDAATIDYGFSLSQNRQINVLPLHAAGFHGEGVRIAVLDTGFFRWHDAFANLNIVAEWDFINDDPVTVDEIVWGSYDKLGQMSHGTSTLGVLGSNWPGRAMGTAWAAEYILAKTERLFDEIQIEEDDYVAALEWADQLGADVVSSSLGYVDWYDYEDMDGKTALCTKAVAIAASHGILVVTAAGNEGGFPWPTLIAPADSPDAITVGATDTLGVIAPFSSRGPTYDGRIKPDVVARGVLVVTVYSQNAQLLFVFNGTSAATPLVAGACALIVQKHPDWSPARVAEALRATASRADTPDNDYGWGIIDAAAASEHAQSISVALDVLPGSCDNPFNPTSRGVLPALVLGTEDLNAADIDVGTLRLGGAAVERSKIVDFGGAYGEEGCARLSQDGRDDLLLAFRAAEVAETIGTAEHGDVVTLALTGALRDGTILEGGASVRIVGRSVRSAASEAPRHAAPAAAIEGARPNPFNPSTRIFYRVPEAAHVHLSVFDVSGRRIATLLDARQPAGTHSVTWNAAGRPSGVYFYRLSVGGVEERRRLVLLK